LLGQHFSGSFIGGGFAFNNNDGTVVPTGVGTGGDVRLYESRPGVSDAMNVYVPAPTRDRNVIAFQHIGGNGGFITVVNGTSFPPLTEPFKGHAFFFNANSNPGPVAGPCFTIAPECTGGQKIQGSTVPNAQLTLIDLKGDALTRSNPLLAMGCTVCGTSVVEDIIRGGVGAFPDTHSITINLQTGVGLSTYVGTLTGIGAFGTIAPEPSTIFVLGSGLLGLVGWCRKRQA
jgi:hypothetical protein